MATTVASSTTATTTGAPTSLAAPLTSNTATDTTNTATSTATGTTSTSKKDPKEKLPQQAPKLSANELERVTEVFKMYETGLREATIYPKVGSLYITPITPSSFVVDDPYFILKCSGKLYLGPITTSQQGRLTNGQTLHKINHEKLTIIMNYIRPF